jgi:hypothetical protein
MLAWNETDFLECLEVEPTIDEYGEGYHYTVKKDGMRLLLSVFQYSSDVRISVFRDGIERAIISLSIRECSGTKRVKDARGDYLEFAPSNVFGERFDSDFVIPVGVRLTVQPTISIELFSN